MIRVKVNREPMDCGWQATLPSGEWGRGYTIQRAVDSVCHDVEDDVELMLVIDRKSVRGTTDDRDAVEKMAHRAGFVKSRRTS